MTTTNSDIQRRLDELFAWLARLPDSEVIMLRGAWEGVETKEREAAWRSVKRVIATSGRQQFLDASRDRLAEWVNNYLSATAAEYGNFLIGPGSGLDPSSVRRAALPPLLDAVAATIAADGLTEDEQDVLLQPVREFQDSLEDG